MEGGDKKKIVATERNVKQLEGEREREGEREKKRNGGKWKKRGKGRRVSETRGEGAK